MPSVPERKMAMMAAEKDIIMNEHDNSSDKDSGGKGLEHLSGSWDGKTGAVQW